MKGKLKGFYGETRETAEKGWVVFCSFPKQHHVPLTVLFKCADFAIKLPQTGVLSPLYKGGFGCYHHGSVSLKRLRCKKFNGGGVKSRRLLITNKGSEGLCEGKCQCG